MPFFEKEKLLLIHIPKTGGTSVEKYLANRCAIDLNVDSLYHRYYEENIENEFDYWKKTWKQKMSSIQADLEKQQINNLQRKRHNSLINEDSSNDGEQLQQMKENMPEYKTFKKIRLCKELKHSLQHMTWTEMCSHKQLLFEQKYWKVLSSHGYERDEYKIITIVRNPYDRIISELLFRGVLTNQTFQDQTIVCNKIKKYLQSYDHFDNHKLPQYLFLIDDAGDLIQNLIILRTETLTQEMQHLGYIDFNHNFQVSKCRFPCGKTKYSKALNQEAIKIINNYYKRDFELFDYDFL